MQDNERLIALLCRARQRLGCEEADLEELGDELRAKVEMGEAIDAAIMALSKKEEEHDE